MSPARPAPERAERLRAPLLIALWALLAFEAIGGLLLFTAYLILGRRPGETAHVLVGVPLAATYAVYQWRHWRRVSPVRARPDHVLGLVAAAAMSLTLLTGLVLGAMWCAARLFSGVAAEVPYPSALSAAHNLGSMLVLSFVGAHLGAVLLRRGSGPDR